MPWTKPPLNMNQRLHWAKKNRISRAIRRDTALLARHTRLPRTCAHATIRLVYYPPDKRTRDADNLTATLKPVCDGLVDYGLVVDDTPAYMTKRMP